MGITAQNERFINRLFWFFCFIVYAGTLFFPLLDKDAAHHANIALHMYQTGDYLSLVDRDKDYLDKPHLLFWVTLAGFKIFGVNTIAHRFPAILFALLSVYSTYRLAKYLAGKATAQLAAVILATAQAFVLSISDARMETPLTASIITGIWQLVLYMDRRKLINLLFAALATAAAFSTKGWLGPVVIFISCFIRIALTGNWRILMNARTWLFIPLFFLFISPVLYAYYYQFDLHPEKVIRNRDHISGVKFILWDQLFERYKGFDEGGRFSDPFYLFHTFLWAFFPWSIIAYMGVFFWLRRIFFYKRKNHPLSFAALSFAFILVAISFSKFKMPHYLVMMLPLAALLTAPYLKLVLSYKRTTRIFYPVQTFFAIAVLFGTIVLNYYFFKPVNTIMFVAGTAALVLFILLLIRAGEKSRKTIYTSAFISLVFNFFLFYNFFPNLLKYQGGNELVKLMKEKDISIPDEQILLLETNAHSFDFYRQYVHPVVYVDTVIEKAGDYRDKYFLVSLAIKKQLEAGELKTETVSETADYNVAKVKLKFLNPSTRSQNFDTLMLVKIHMPQ